MLFGLVAWFGCVASAALFSVLGLCLGLVGWLVLLSCMFGLGLGAGCVAVWCVKPLGFALILLVLAHVPSICLRSVGCEGCLGWSFLSVWLCLGLVGWLVLLSCVFGFGLGLGCVTVGFVEPPAFAWFCPVLPMSPAFASGQLWVMMRAWGSSSFVFGFVWACLFGLCCPLVCLAWVWGLVV